MYPRIRTIKPQFFHDEELADLGDVACLIYIGLWCYADRQGRLEDRPRYLQSQIRPYDPETWPAAFDALVTGGWVVRYTVNGRSYLHLPKFAEHQRPHHTEPHSALPDPVGELTVSARCAHREDTVSAPDTHREDTVSSKERKGKERKEKGKEEERESPAAPAQATATVAPTPNGQHTATLILETWNRHSPPLSPALGLTGRRLAHARARWQEHPDPGWWSTVLDRLVTCPFLLGANERGWHATFDWLLQPDSALRVLEGKYDRAATALPTRSLQNLSAAQQAIANMRAKRVGSA